MRNARNPTIPRRLRAIFGVLVLIVVLAIILSWIGDFRQAQRGGDSTRNTTESSDVPAGPVGANGAEAAGTAEQGQTLIVIVDGLNLRAGPNRGTRSLKVLSDGTELKILQKDGQWYRVEHPDGVTGYVLGDDEYVRIN